MAAGELYVMVGQKEVAMVPAPLEALLVLLAWLTPVAQLLVLVLVLGVLVAINGPWAQPSRGLRRRALPTGHEGA